MRFGTNCTLGGYATTAPAAKEKCRNWIDPRPSKSPLVHAILLLVLGCTVSLAQTELPEISCDTTGRSIGGTGSINVTWVNATDTSVDVDWVDSSGNDLHFFTLQPGQSRLQQAYTTHRWRALDTMTHACIGDF